MTQCVFLLAFTALKNDCSFLRPLEPESEEVTFTESLFTPSSAQDPCVSSGRLRRALALTPGAASRPPAWEKLWARASRAGEGLLCGWGWGSGQQSWGSTASSLWPPAWESSFPKEARAQPFSRTIQRLLCLTVASTLSFLAPIGKLTENEGAFSSPRCCLV